jgi:small subunit ribosomal protein S11|tara:strand:+ start:414 stop:761 length:348 start_codon:yes stop_codon:yes gene_type:complete
MRKQIIKISVKTTLNNTILHATIPNNRSIILSPGMLGFKGSKRSTPHAAQQTAEILAEKLIENRLLDVTLFFKGFGKGKKSILKGLLKKQINIIKYVDQTPKIHNGCREKKKRRL